MSSCATGKSIATADVIGALALNSVDGFSVRLIERFQEWRFGASRHSVRAIYGDLKRFGAWTKDNGEPAIPASIDGVRDYISHLKYDRKSLSTIERALSSISLAHRLAGVVDPTKDETVKWRMKGVRRDLAGTRGQAFPLRYDAGLISLSDMLALTIRKLSDLRDKAMVSTAYDTGLRRAELVAVEGWHIRASEDGFELFIPVIKGGTEGFSAFLTAETVRLLKTWMREAGIPDEMKDQEGHEVVNPVFRAVDRFGRTGKQALSPDSVARIFKAMARRAGETKGLSKEAVNDFIKGFSGHSTRVGSTQDLFAANVEIGPICDARRWKSPRMALRYTEVLAIQEGPVAEVLAGQRAPK